jgi:hypothetical protein
MGSSYLIENTWVKGIGEETPVKAIKAYEGSKTTRRVRKVKIHHV